MGFNSNPSKETEDKYSEYIDQPVGIYCDRTISYGIFKSYNIEEREITLQPSIIYFCQKPRIEEDYPKKILLKNVNLVIIDPLKEGDLERIVEDGIKKMTNEFEGNDSQKQDFKEDK